MLRVKHHEKFSGVYWVFLEDGSRRLATLNMTPSRGVYGERLVTVGKKEYRVWDPYRSKLAAAVYKGLKTFPIDMKRRVLYLGAASGTTASHVSDIIGPRGRVYCVDFSERSIRDLVSNVSAYRENMIPLLADARYPETYRMMMEKVDFIYCDVAQPEQARILADNAEAFLEQRGKVSLIIKARSIDVTKEPSEVFEHEIQTLKDRGFKETEVLNLEPYHGAHSIVIAEYSA